MPAAPGEGMARSRKDRQGNWAGKANVIESLNEFIVELKDIESTVALHVRSHMAFRAPRKSNRVCQTSHSAGQQ